MCVFPFQPRQIKLDYGMFASEDGVDDHDVSDGRRAEGLGASRVPTGHQRRDRASLRAKHKQEMEKQQSKKMSQISNSRYANHGGVV
jgi:hypothetical protein